MDALATALELTEGAVDVMRLARLTVDRAHELLDSDAVWLYAWDGAANILSPLAYSDPSPPQPLPVARPGQGAIGLAFQRREPVIVDDYQSWDQALAWGKDRHTGSVIAVPLLAGDGAVGVLFAKSRVSRHIACAEVAHATLLAAQVAPAFDRLQRSAEAERRRGEAEALAELMRQGATESDTDRVIGLVTEYAGLLLGADYTLVELTLPDGTTAVQGCWGNRSDAWRTVRGPAGTGAASHALAAGHTIIIERLGENADYPPTDYPIHCSEGGRTVLIARLVSQQQAFGSLGVGWHTDVPVMPAQVRLAETLASYAATIIDNARARTRELQFMREAAARLEELAASEAALARLNRQTELILAAAGDGIYGLDDAGRTTFINPAAARLLGYEPAELLGQMQHDLVHYARPDGAPYSRHDCPIYATLARGVTHHVADEVFWRKDGTPFPVEYTSTPIHEGGAIVGAVITFKDITERKQAEAALTHQALHDALTGLPNRVLLHDRLEQALHPAAHGDGAVALLLLDLNRFKEVNDTLGHHCGDLLLRQVGVRILGALHATDTVARLGGDEFAVLLPATDIAGATRAADKILAALETPISVEGRSRSVGASIGIALVPAYGADATTLLRRADMAMYAAKQAGSGYAIYDAQHDQHSSAPAA